MALAHPDRDPNRPWLLLHRHEQKPSVIAAGEPITLTWSWPWPELPTARVRFDLSDEAGASRLTWMLLLENPLSDAEEVRRLRHRIDQLVNSNLRDRFDG